MFVCFCFVGWFWFGLRFCTREIISLKNKLVWNCPDKLIILLLITFAGFEQVKNSFWRNSVTYGTPCDVIYHFDFWFYRKCYGFERPFFTLRPFLPYNPSCWFQGFPGNHQLNLKVSRASCWSSKHSPSPTICLNHNSPQKKYSGRFYLWFMAGWLREVSAPQCIWTLFMAGRVC